MAKPVHARRIIGIAIAAGLALGVVWLFSILLRGDTLDSVTPKDIVQPEIEDSAERVDALLAGNIRWREAHPVTKARLRVTGAPAAPVGVYYLDLRPAQATEVAITSVLLGKAELVARTVKEAGTGLMFFNEEVYVKFDLKDLSSFDGPGFWMTRDVAAARARLTEMFDIRGVTRKTVDDVTYSGIHMELKKARWEEHKAKIAPTVVANFPASFWQYATVFFGPSGELHSIQLTGGEVDVEVLYYDWIDLANDTLAELDHARRPPQANQEQWDMPLDTAAVRYVVKLTE